MSLLVWSLAGVLLWYALVIDRAKLSGVIGLIATGIAFEFIHRVFGGSSEDSH